MITSNPFAELTALISPEIMQGYIILMAILVFLGTVLDMMHKKSAKYFFEDAKKAKANAKRTVGAGEKAGLAVAQMKGKTYLSLGYTSMGIAGSMVNPDFFQDYLGMRTEFVD